MTTLRLELELLTPAYAGGARGGEKATPSDLPEPLRGPVLKNLLRFWWRTLHPGFAPQQLFAREERIFGSANPRVGQRLRVVPRSPSALDDARVVRKDKPTADWALSYLGYGVQQNVSGRGVLHACPAYLPGNGNEADWKFDLEVSRLRPGEGTELTQAAWLLAAFGGFGRRSRRGFGALRLRRALDGLPAFEAETVSQAIAALAQGLGTVAPHAAFAGLPPHTAFSAGARLVVLSGQNGFFSTANEALGVLEEVFKVHRRGLGWYRQAERHPGRPEGLDHKWRHATVSAAREWEEKSSPPPSPTWPPGDAMPCATAFGAPLPGTLSSKWAADVGVQQKDGGSAIDHRASPLLMSVSGWGPGRFLPTLLYLPATFLPDDAELRVLVRKPKPGGKKPEIDVASRVLGTARPDSGEVRTFLDWFVRRGAREVRW